MIRKATEHDIDAVEQGYTELLTNEKENGSSSNWVLGVYPTRSVAEASCAAGTLYVMEEEDGICASMILNQVPIIIAQGIDRIIQTCDDYCPDIMGFLVILSQGA